MEGSSRTHVRCMETRILGGEVDLWKQGCELQEHHSDCKDETSTKDLELIQLTSSLNEIVSKPVIKRADPDV